MMMHVPTVLSQTGLALRLQLVEVTDDFILIRLRSDETHPSQHPGGTTLLVMDEWFTLSDPEGTTAELFQKSSGGGPFAGQVDLAFRRVPEIDLGATLTLASQNAHLTLQLSTR